MPEPNRPAFPRISIAALAALTVVVVLGLRLVHLARQPVDETTASPRFTIPASRGSIWDRDGWLLATDRYEYAVVAAPSSIGKPVEAAAILSPVIGIPADDIVPHLVDRSLSYVPLVKGAPYAVARKLTELDVVGIDVEKSSRRLYPLGAAAAHVTGFVLDDGRVSWGMEASADDLLRGTDGQLGGNYGSETREFVPARNGHDLVLTIDRELQLECAAILARAVEIEEASGGTIIVMDPASGAILASTSLPSYDPNQYARATVDQYRDPAVAAVWEPGSIAKPLTLAAAFEAGVAAHDSSYVDEGTIEYAGISVSNSDHTAHGPTTMAELMQYSLNVGAVHVAAALGPQRFYAKLADFGLGSRTGVEMNDEAPGLVHWPDEPDWFPGHLATNSFGQGLAATPLQMVSAIGALANDGVLMAPHFVAAAIDQSGSVERTVPRSVRRVVSAQTAREVRDLMVEVVSGRVTQAALPGVTIGGKTGTSQVVMDGGYAPDTTIASFVGFLPAERPQVVALIKIDHPISKQGSDAAAPVFREIAMACIDILGLAVSPRPGQVAAAP